MSAGLAVLLDVSRVRVLSRAGTGAPLDIPWNPNAPADAAARVAVAFGTGASMVLVIGLGFLEVARPELPPMSAADRHALLRRDADRYLPLDGELAIAWTDGLAFALPAVQLNEWVREFERVGRVEAIATLPQLCAGAAESGAFVVDAGHEERGVVTIHGGRVESVRRIPNASGDAPPERALDLPRALRAALSFVDAPLTSQLLDTGLFARLQARRGWRMARAAALLAASLLMVGWSAARWRTRERDALVQRVAQLRGDASGAQASAARLASARIEQRLLASTDSALAADVRAEAVLARLSTLLPSDAFVQRLEWDGSSWRLDGSADDAPRIVPLLDADAHFANVRIVAASTRFLDAGRQRESFSIAFDVRAIAGGARGGQ